MDAGSEQELHTMQLDETWRRSDLNGLYHGIEETGRKTNASSGLRLIQDRSQGGSCCSFIEIATSTLCTTWSEFERLETKRCIAKCGHRDADRSPLLLETAKAHKLVETKVMTGTDLELKTVLLQKKREGQHFERAELNRLWRAIWRKRRQLKRRKHLTKIKERAETRNAPKKTQSKHFNWNSTA